MPLHRKWLLGGIGASILLFLLGFFLLVNPARNQAAEINAQAEQVEQSNLMLTNKLNTVKQQSTEVPAKLEEIEAIRRKMPSEMKQADLVRAIEQEAQSAGVDLTGIAPATPIAVEGSTTGTIALPMSVTAVGRYANVKTFVDNLERLERAFLIQTVDVTVADEALDSFTLTLQGSFFSLPEGTLDTPDTAAATPAPTEAPAASAAAKTSKKQSAAKSSDKKADSKKSSKDKGNGKADKSQQDKSQAKKSQQGKD